MVQFKTKQPGQLEMKFGFDIFVWDREEGFDECDFVVDVGLGSYQISTAAVTLQRDV